jgi:apurinic endonuclease APN1
MIKIGYNMSTSIDKESLQNAKKDGCNFIQIFTGDPCKFIYNKNQFNTTQFNRTQFNRTQLKYWDGGIVIHGNFLINLCRPPTDKIAKNSIYLLKKDLDISIKINAIGVIIHMGKDTAKLGYKNALDTYVENLNKVLQESKKGIIILETGAGVGTEVGTRLNELGKIRDKVIDKNRIKFCIDTCHIFAAGYDISNDIIVDSLEGYIENTLGWENIIVLHCNDSKNCLCSKKDFHADITDGIISKENIGSFMKFVNFFKKRNIPIILETPSDSVDLKIQIDFILFNN